MGVLSIVVTIAIIVLIIILVKYWLSDPYTLQNVQSAETASTIAASSLATTGSGSSSSNFTYSVWFFINDWNYRYGEPKVVFGRMGAPSTSGQGSLKGVSGLDPCPAVVLDPTQNNISISLGCYPGADQSPTTAGGTTVVSTFSIENIPIQKWVNLVISVYGRTMDLYIDGKLVRTGLLPGVASINNDANIYVTPDGGFDGYTAKLQFFPTSMNPQQVWNNYTQGYQGTWFSNFFGLGNYQVQIALVENGVSQGTLTI
jgi:Concanavalin A-like lectin/glucanases superfamily